jgi:hypothetical protein
MNNPALTRVALEGIWRERTKGAHSRYRIAKAECAKAVSMQSDVEPADGTFGYRKALALENVALAEYKRVLTIFTELTVHGKMPPAE